MDIDLFASRLNNKKSAYMYHLIQTGGDPHAMAIDALDAVLWKNE
jgi:hypothetical protein